MIHEGDMECGSGKPPTFDGTNYLYWKIRMSTYLQSLGSRVWEICEDTTYVVLVVWLTQDQIDQHDANCKARNALFAYLSPSEFDRVSHLPTAWEI